MKVRAKQFGFYGGHPRYAGSVFEIPDGHRLGSWMEEVIEGVVVAEEPKRKRAAKKEPETFSEMTPEFVKDDNSPL